MTSDRRKELVQELALVNKSNNTNLDLHFYGTFDEKTKQKKQNRLAAKGRHWLKDSWTRTAVLSYILPY